MGVLPRMLRAKGGLPKLRSSPIKGQHRILALNRRSHKNPPLPNDRSGTTLAGKCRLPDQVGTRRPFHRVNAGFRAPGILRPPPAWPVPAVLRVCKLRGTKNRNREPSHPPIVASPPLAGDLETEGDYRTHASQFLGQGLPNASLSV